MLDTLGKYIVLVAGAGNWNNEEEYYPASHPKVISVAAHTAGGFLWSSSNRAERVDISAPGYQIFTTDMIGRSGPMVDHDMNPLTPEIPEFYLGYHAEQFVTQSGTSLSAPHVAAVALMIADQWPALTPAEIKQQLILSCQELNQSEPSHLQERGLNAAKALDALLVP
jgi:subtilisin family serine protease